MKQGIGVVLLLSRTYLVPGGSEEWRAAQRSFRRRLITFREFGLTGTCDVVVSDSISWYVIATAKLLRSWCGNDSVRLGWGGGEKLRVQGGGGRGGRFVFLLEAAMYAGARFCFCAFDLCLGLGSRLQGRSARIPADSMFNPYNYVPGMYLR